MDLSAILWILFVAVLSIWVIHEKIYKKSRKKHQFSSIFEIVYSFIIFLITLPLVAIESGFVFVFACALSVGFFGFGLSRILVLINRKKEYAASQLHRANMKAKKEDEEAQIALKKARELERRQQAENALPRFVSKGANGLETWEVPVIEYKSSEYAYGLFGRCKCPKCKGLQASQISSADNEFSCDDCKYRFINSLVTGSSSGPASFANCPYCGKQAFHARGRDYNCLHCRKRFTV